MVIIHRLCTAVHTQNFLLLYFTNIRLGFFTKAFTSGPALYCRLLLYCCMVQPPSSLWALQLVSVRGVLYSFTLLISPSGTFFCARLPALCGLGVQQYIDFLDDEQKCAGETTQKTVEFTVQFHLHEL